ncbi:MAG: hypothetical protein ACI9SE_003764 [Neolewinella sp.]|jgi:hypothetical protein
MTDSSHSNDDADFLDEDFVIEDLVGKNDDLEDLFDEPAHPEDDSTAVDEEVDAEAVAETAEQPAPEPDEDDMLFSDHTEGIEEPDLFEKPVFAEDGTNDWDGDNLDLESVGVPGTTIESEEEAADPQIEEAEESFAAELESLLHEDEDFALDSEADLEFGSLADEVNDGISEFEQSGPFVLDDSDGLWADELAEASSETPGEAPGEFLVEASGDDTSIDAAPADRAPTYEELTQQLEAVGAQDGFEDVELGRTDEPEAEFTLANDDECDSFDLEVDATDEEGVLPEQSIEEEGLTLVSAGDQMVADAFGEGHTIASDGPISGDDEVAADATEGELEGENLETMPLLNAAAFADGSVEGEAGWEPLPTTSMDELSEVDEVQRTDDEEEYDVSGYEEDEPESLDDQGDESYSEEYAGAASETDLDDVDGHDIYAEEGTDKRGVVLGGPGSRRSTASLLLSVAASLLVLFGAATVVLRPELFGLSVEPERVAKVDVARPKVEVAVVEPPKVALQNEILSEPNTGEPATGSTVAGNSEATGNPSGPGTSNPETGNPDASQINAGQPKQPASAGDKRPETVPAVPTNTGGKPAEISTTQPAEVLASGGNDVTSESTATGNTPAVVQVPDAAGSDANSWPVAKAPENQTATSKKPALTRFGDGLLVGGVASGIAEAKAMDGVMPGSRAFAQLHNGNYFIGKVKQIAAETITLRVETGEVTLATAEIAQLTRLGTTDYDELQKATKGFVRLTNNNRLVGGILSRIADDHIVLEFRSNRVMLPRSAIGEIVSGTSSVSKVRLGTTTEEDSWIRALAERELGTGQGAPVNQVTPGNPETPVHSGPQR